MMKILQVFTKSAAFANYKIIIFFCVINLFLLINFVNYYFFMSNLEVIERLTNELGSEYHLSHYVDNMTDGFFDWRIQEDYEYMSPKFWKIFGYKPEEKEHKPSSWIDLINKEDFEKAQKKLNQHIKSKGKEPYKIKCRYQHKEGHEVTVICRGKIIEWDGDVPLRMIGTHTDITGL